MARNAAIAVQSAIVVLMLLGALRAFVPEPVPADDPLADWAAFDAAFGQFMGIGIAVCAALVGLLSWYSLRSDRPTVRIAVDLALVAVGLMLALSAPMAEGPVVFQVAAWLFVALGVVGAALGTNAFREDRVSPQA
jgi:hypothetical protein